MNEITSNIYQNLKNNFSQNIFSFNHKSLKENYFLKEFLIKKKLEFIINTSYIKDKILFNNEKINNMIIIQIQIKIKIYFKIILIIH